MNNDAYHRFLRWKLSLEACQQKMEIFRGLPTFKLCTKLRIEKIRDVWNPLVAAGAGASVGSGGML